MLKNKIGAMALGSLVLGGGAGVLGGFGVTAEGAGLERGVEAGVAAAADGVYEVDSVHSNVLFKIRHAGVTNFYGRFNEFKGSVDFDESDFTNSSVRFEIPISSIDTNSKTRDGHLKDAEFFNARQFPKASFESTSITKGPGGAYTLKGDLTLHGVTKEISAKVTDLRTGSFRDRPVLGFQADFSIQRSDFEIMKYLASDLSDSGPLGNTVEITVAIEAGQG